MQCSMFCIGVYIRTISMCFDSSRNIALSNINDSSWITGMPDDINALCRHIAQIDALE